MIVTKLMGGMGNQMFQFAAGYALSRKLNTQLYLDLSWFSQDLLDSGITPRKYELDYFGLDKYILINSKIIKEKNNVIKDFILRLSGSKFKVIVENNLDYTYINLKKGDNLYLNGYWQSYQYFIDYEEDIKSIFLSPFVLLDRVNIELSNRICESNSVSIHVRRGDYVTNKSANAFHGLCTLNYYHAAVDYLDKKGLINSEAILFVFSDDISWVKESLNFNYETIFVSHNSLENSRLDLFLMSLCKHHILANSSFSWWGSYLSRSQGLTIYPKNWYVNSDHDISYMFPEYWVRL